MRKSLLGIAAGLAGLALLVGGIGVASNMGFKFVPNVAAGQYFNLAMPWNNSFSAGKVHTLFTDLRTQDGDLESMTKYTATGGFTSWYQGADPSADYNIVKGEAYILKAGAGPVSSSVVVGSHDPAFTFSFTGGQYFNAAAPYHQTFTRANQLFNDMTTQLAGKIESVTKYTATGGFTSWYQGADPSANFTLDLGMGVIVKASASASGYVWPHY